MLFRTKKWSSNIVKKYRHFAKGLVHGFRQKIDVFLICFFFLPKKAKKKHFLLFCRENKPFWTSKVKFSQILNKRHFAKGLVHGFYQKIDLFLMFLFWAKKGRKKHFSYSGYKTMLFRPEKWSSNKIKEYQHFAKGLVHGFCQKIDHFLICFFWAENGRKKHFFIFWIEKNAF